MSNSKKLIVIDGNSLIYRAFYAIPLLRTSTGTVTNAAYGFANMLLKILKDEHPNFIIVTFDKGRTTFRTEQYSEYKANRKPVPDDLKHQFQLVKDILAAMNIKIFELDNYEADDLIGTIVKNINQDVSKLIITGDRDILQLISQDIKVLTTRKGITQLEMYDKDKVFEKFGVYPDQFVDFRAMIGDASDNIPGVPGVGAKTAAKLLQKYQTLDNILDNLHELPKKQREKLEQNRDQLLLSKQLTKIKCDLPIDIDLKNCCYRDPNHAQLFDIFKKLEFSSLIKSLDLNNKASIQEDAITTTDTNQRFNKSSVNEVADMIELEILLKNSQQVSLVLDGSKNHLLAAVIGIANNDEYKSFYISLEDVEQKSMDILKKICQNKKIITHNAKDVIWSLRNYDIKLNNLGFDTMIAAYLLNPNNPNLEVNDIAYRYLNLEIKDCYKKEMLLYQSSAILQLEEVLKNKLIEQHQEKLFYEVELPLVSILAEMEITGMAVNTDVLRTMSKELDKKINLLIKQIYDLTGTVFNINSTKQLGEVLFKKLKFPVVKKTKTGYSTAASVLEELLIQLTAPRDIEIIEKLMEYRQLTKLKSTYTDGLLSLVNPKTGCIHTTFNQTATATGRLSSTDPNLQNIPVRLEVGREIRKAFIPRKPNNLIVSADYSQIELRILAHFSKDDNLINAFKSGRDIHTATAAEIFDIPIDKVIPKMRRQAKAVNFGIIYGLSSFGLARDIKITQTEARKYIEKYFERYPKVKKFINSTIKKAKEQGYITTIFNRRRYLPELSSRNHNIKNFGERAAINTPIQGSAADIIKLAMVQMSKKLRENTANSKMILQIHDELIFDVPKEEVDNLIELARQIMENAVELDVPLIVDFKVGENWYNTKPIT